MKKCLVVLTSGVTIEFNDGDEVTIKWVNEEYDEIVDIDMIPLALKWVNSEVSLNAVTHIARKDGNEVKVEYYIPSDKISWCYVQEVKDEQITNQE